MGINKNPRRTFRKKYLIRNSNKKHGFRIRYKKTKRINILENARKLQIEINY